PDSGQIISYSIVHVDKTEWISIDSTSGVMYANENFQSSYDHSFELLVQVTDNAPHPLSDSAKATIYLSGYDITPPVITSFELPSLALDLTIPINSFVASDDMRVTGYLVSESSVDPTATDEDWSSGPPNEFVFSE